MVAERILPAQNDRLDVYHVSRSLIYAEELTGMVTSLGDLIEPCALIIGGTGSVPRSCLHTCLSEQSGSTETSRDWLARMASTHNVWLKSRERNVARDLETPKG